LSPTIIGDVFGPLAVIESTMVASCWRQQAVISAETAIPVASFASLSSLNSSGGSETLGRVFFFDGSIDGRPVFFGLPDMVGVGFEGDHSTHLKASKGFFMRIFITWV
jgi:hypothetical protein